MIRSLRRVYIFCSLTRRNCYPLQIMVVRNSQLVKTPASLTSYFLLKNPYLGHLSMIKNSSFHHNLYKIKIRFLFET